MNIMLLADHYPPVYLGGGETHVESLATSLHEKGHKVIVFTLASTGLPNFEKNNGISIYRFDGLFQTASFLFRNPSAKLHPPIRDPFIMKRLKVIIKRERPHVMHAHISGGWIMCSALPLKEKLGIPVVVTLHNYGLLCPVLTLTKDGKQCQHVLTNKCVRCGVRVYGGKSFPVYLFLRLNKSRLKRVDKFIAISQYQKSVFARETGLNETGIVVIPNSVDCEKFSLSKSANEKTKRELDKLGLNHCANRIVHISSLNANKLSSIKGIINAAPKIVEKFPHTQILIVGDGGLFNDVARLARRVNQRLRKQVIIMTGFVKNDDMPKIMSFADIVIGVGRGALEAMACGKPVVIAGTSIGPFGGNYGGVVTKCNVNELSAHNFSGRNSFEKTTPEKIAQDCMGLLEDEEYRSSLGIFGRKYVEQEHDIRKAVQKLEDVYNDVTTRSK